MVGSFATNERGEIGVEKGGEIRVGDVVIGVNQTTSDYELHKSWI